MRATAAFFDDVDRQLPAERTADGRPSAHDFQVFELLGVVEAFATQFDALPELIELEVDTDRGWLIDDDGGD